MSVSPKIILVIVVLVVVGATGYFFLSNQQTSQVLYESPLVEAENLYDDSKWELVSKQSNDLDGDRTPEDIYYLKSLQPLDSSGLDEPEYGVQVVIAKNQKTVFAYSPSENREESYSADYYRPDSGATKNFYFEDITGDDTPEIIFIAGFNGVSDYRDCYYLITFNRKDSQYKTLNPGMFCTSFNSGVQITKVASNFNGSQIITALPSNGQVGGNKVEQPFDIAVYTWDGYTFSKYKSFRSSRDYEGGGNAIQGEAYSLQKAFYTTP